MDWSRKSLRRQNILYKLYGLQLEIRNLTQLHDVSLHTMHIQGQTKFPIWRADLTVFPPTAALKAGSFTRGEEMTIISVLLSFALSLFLVIQILISALRHSKDLLVSLIIDRPLWSNAIQSCVSSV